MSGREVQHGPPADAWVRGCPVQALRRLALPAESAGHPPPVGLVPGELAVEFGDAFELGRSWSASWS
jgi:hypothetical protein